MSELEQLRNENRQLREQINQYEKMEKEWEERERKLLGKLKRTKATLDSRTKMLEEMNQKVAELKKLVPKHARKPSGPEIPMAAQFMAQGMGALRGSDEEEDEDEQPSSASSSNRLAPMIDRDPKIESTDKGRIKRKSMVLLDSKMSQRPTIEETIYRGIIFHRPDTRTDHSVLAQSSLLAKRRASAQIGRALEARKSVQELRSRGIYKDTEDMVEDTKRKRRVSRVLEATLNPRSRATMEDLTQSGITLASLFSEGTGVESADLEAFGGAGRSGRRARGSGELASVPIEEGDEDAKTREDFGPGASSGYADEEEKVVEVQQWIGVDLPADLSFEDKMKRVDLLYATRDSVEELIFRGILKGHPSLRSRMNRIKRKKERRENKLVIDFLYRRRPRDNDTMMKRLVDMRILPKESLKAREIHKRRLSRQLEASLISRPTPQEINDDMGYQVIDLGPLLLSFLVGSAMVEAQNAMTGPVGPTGQPVGGARAIQGPPGSGPGQLGSAVDPFTSHRAADLAGGGGVGMVLGGQLMNAAQAAQHIGGSGRRGSADSDVSDLGANADRELLKNLQQEVADKEAEIRSQQKIIDQLRTREKDYLNRIELMEHKYQDSLKEVSDRSAEVDGTSRQTVDVAIDELHRTQLDLQQAQIYIEILRKRMESRGVRLETEEDLKTEIKEKLAHFVIARPTIEDLMARNIIPTQQSSEAKQRASAVVSSHLDSVKMSGIKERTYLATVEEVTPGGPSSSASEAELDSLTGMIDDLNAQVQKLKGENESLVNELDDLRKLRSDGDSGSSGVSFAMDQLRKWILGREWMASSKKFVERESDKILGLKDDQSVLDNLKTVIRTYMDEVSEMFTSEEATRLGLEAMYNETKDKLSATKEELAEAQAKLFQAEADHTTPGGPDEYGGSSGVDQSEFESLKKKVEQLEQDALRAAKDKMTMMSVMSNEMDSLRSQLRRMGRMQRSLVAMGTVQDT